MDKGLLRLEDILGLKPSKGSRRSDGGDGDGGKHSGLIDGLQEALRNSGNLAQVREWGRRVGGAFTAGHCAACSLLAGCSGVRRCAVLCHAVPGVSVHCSV